MIWSLGLGWVVIFIVSILFESEELLGGGRETRGAQSKMVAQAPLCPFCSRLFQWAPRFPEAPATSRGGARRTLVPGICGGRGSSHLPSGSLGPLWEQEEEPAYGPSWTFLTLIYPPLFGVLSKCLLVVSLCFLEMCLACGGSNEEGCETIW